MLSEEIPAGVSIESASYIEKNTDTKPNEPHTNEDNFDQETLKEEYTPKLFSDDQMKDDTETDIFEKQTPSEQLFDQDINEEEDFEIPAFLRRQKF